MGVGGVFHGDAVPSMYRSRPPNVKIVVQPLRTCNLIKAHVLLDSSRSFQMISITFGKSIAFGMEESHFKVLAGFQVNTHYE